MDDKLFEKPLSEWKAREFQEVEVSGGLAHVIAYERSKRLCDELNAFRDAPPHSGGLADLGAMSVWMLERSLKLLIDEIRVAYPIPGRRPAPTKSRVVKNRPAKKKIS